MVRRYFQQHGQLGHGGRTCLKRRRQVRFPSLVSVRGVACGRSHTVALCASAAGDASASSESLLLFAWGSDSHGQLGLGSGALCHADHGRQLSVQGGTLFVDGIARPVAWGARGAPASTGLEGGARIVGVEERLGGTVTLAVSADDVPSFEMTIHNPEQTGVRDAMDCVLSPTSLRTALPDGEVWAVLACGEIHTAAITSGGGAYCWGCAEDGRLGLPLSDHELSVDAVVRAPRRLPLSLSGRLAAGSVAGIDAAADVDSRPATVDCGDDFTAFVDARGVAWGCGANYAGQLGLDETIDEWPAPTRLLPSVDVGVDSLSCGARHMAAVDGLGRLWLWGEGFGAQPHIVPLPTAGGNVEVAEAGGLAEGTECALIACGSGVTFAVTDDGDAFMWGGHSEDYLAAEAELEPQHMHTLSAPEVRVSMVACGKACSSLDQGPPMLVLAAPEAPEQLSAQFNRFLLTEAPRVN